MVYRRIWWNIHTQVEKIWKLTLWKLQLPEVYYIALCTKNKWRVSKRYKWGGEIFSERGVAVQPTGSMSSITCARPLPALPTFNPPHVTIPSNCSIWLCHLTVTRCHFPCGLESTTSKSTTMYPPQTTLKPLLPTSLLITKIFFLHASYCHGVTVRFHILAVQ